MNAARPGSLGATRVCPHCKATVLASADICPGCQHHLRFATGAAKQEPKVQSVPAMSIEGTVQHKVRDEACEYCVVVSITNERGEKITRQVVGVGALQPGEKHKVSFAVEVMPVRRLPTPPPKPAPQPMRSQQPLPPLKPPGLKR
jgi:hypothetical protein